MRILITNDDGIYSPGIAALAKVETKFGEVRVVAPDVEQSSMGHAITASRPLSYKKSPIHFEGIQAFRVSSVPRSRYMASRSPMYFSTLPPWRRIWAAMVEK